MSRTRRYLLGTASIAAALVLGLLLGRLLVRHSRMSHPAAGSVTHAALTASTAGDPDVPTQVYAHNIMLRKGPDFRVYLLWISGRMLRTRPQINPSFDDPESFILHIDRGVIHANIGDIARYINATAGTHARLRNIEIQPDGDLVKIRGTVKKVVPLPVEIVGSLAPASGGRVRLHVQRISVLRMPVKGLLHAFDVKISDLMQSTDLPGISVSGNDIVLDTEKLLPPPHIQGELASVRVSVPDIEVVYGNAPNDPSRLAQWHNFLRFRQGAFNFGKLTMHNADLTMIDAVDEPWFDLDLVNYQNQIVNGYTRITAEAGLEIYMPSLKARMPVQPGKSVTLEWLKNRNTSLPPDVAKKARAH